jgi:hypothetical protein
MARSALLIVLLLAVWILSHFFKAAWPEQLVLFGCVGTVLFASPVAQLFLLVVAGGVAARLTLLTRWVRTAWQQRMLSAAQAAKPA